MLGADRLCCGASLHDVGDQHRAARHQRVRDVRQGRDHQILAQGNVRPLPDHPASRRDESRLRNYHHGE